jgi:hypothetical protein
MSRGLLHSRPLIQPVAFMDGPTRTRTGTPPSASTVPIPNTGDANYRAIPVHSTPVVSRHDPAIRPYDTVAARYQAAADDIAPYIQTPIALDTFRTKFCPPHLLSPARSSSPLLPPSSTSPSFPPHPASTSSPAPLFSLSPPSPSAFPSLPTYPSPLPSANDAGPRLLSLQAEDGTRPVEGGTLLAQSSAEKLTDTTVVSGSPPPSAKVEQRFVSLHAVWPNTRDVLVLEQVDECKHIFDELNFIIANTSSRGGHGGEGSLKPDFSVYSSASAPLAWVEKEKTYKFDPAVCELVGDIKHDKQDPFVSGTQMTGDRIHTLGQISTYTAEILTRQHRTHLFMVLRFDTTFRLLRWDRAGVIVTEREKDMSKLHEFFEWFNASTPAQRGLDPTVRQANDVSETLFLENLMRYATKELHLAKHDLEEFKNQHYEEGRVAVMTIDDAEVWLITSCSLSSALLSTSRFSSAVPSGSPGKQLADAQEATWGSRLILEKLDS